MGQTVIVNEVKELDDVLLLDTDRSFTGQDGIAMSPANGVVAFLALSPVSSSISGSISITSTCSRTPSP